MKMDRREEIIKILREADTPMTASSLAAHFDVTRQVIVGDVSILRAAGHEIIATSRGYMLGSEDFSDAAGRFRFVGMVACCHTSQQLIDELYTIVDNGATVIDVTIEHAIYGELSGKLDLSSRYDVDQFIQKVKEEKNSTPISTLTGGIHLHRIGCRDKATFERISKALDEQGILIK